MHKSAILILLLFSSACKQTNQGYQKPTEGAFDNPYKSSDHGLQAGQVIIQGMFGAAKFEEVQRSGGDIPAIGNGGNLTQMPLIGGNWQMVLGGDRIDWGLDVGGTLGFRSDGGTVTPIGAGTVAVDIDMSLFDLYGGPFISMNLGEKIRVYGGVGPMMQFANYNHKNNRPSSDPLHVNDSGTGFGLGWYSRLGAELAISRGMMVGLGGRWIDSTVDLSGGLGDLDIAGAQVYLTFSTGF